MQLKVTGQVTFFCLNICNDDFFNQTEFVLAIMFYCNSIMDILALIF